MRISLIRTSHWQVASVALLIAAVTACDRTPVTWLDGTELATRHPSPLSFPAPMPLDSSVADSSDASRFLRTQDLLRDAGAQSMLAAVLATMPESQSALAPTAPTAMPAMVSAPGNDLGNGDEPRDANRCPRSLRLLFAPGRGDVGVWWTRRAHGRVALMAAWRMRAGDTTTGTWRGPIEIDTLDVGPGDANAAERGNVSCVRAAPGVAIDAKNGYVHVAYAINAPEGPGVFYAHQMDPRAVFEKPIVIVYGDRRLGAARVATAGDVVAVVYEDPNAPLSVGKIGLAISRTSGHSFEERMQVNRSSRAIDPYVGLEGRALVVGWTEQDTDANVPQNVLTAFRMRRATLR